MKNSNYTIGNRTRDLPACSAVPQPTALPRTPSQNSVSLISTHWKIILSSTALVNYRINSSSASFRNGRVSPRQKIAVELYLLWRKLTVSAAAVSLKVLVLQE